MAKSINFKKAKPILIRRLEPGDLIEFLYKGVRRNGIVITPDWKESCDCYAFKYLRDVPIELAEWIIEHEYLDDGDLFVDFDNEFDFRSFKHSDMISIRVIEFNIEDKKIEKKEEKKEVGFEKLLSGNSSEKTNIDLGTIYE